MIAILDGYNCHLLYIGAINNGRAQVYNIACYVLNSSAGFFFFVKHRSGWLYMYKQKLISRSTLNVNLCAFCVDNVDSHLQDGGFKVRCG